MAETIMWLGRLSQLSPMHGLARWLFTVDALGDGTNLTAAQSFQCSSMLAATAARIGIHPAFFAVLGLNIRPAWWPR